MSSDDASGKYEFGIAPKLTLLIVRLPYYEDFNMSIDSWIICLAAPTADAFN